MWITKKGKFTTLIRRCTEAKEIPGNHNFTPGIADIRSMSFPHYGKLLVASFPPYPAHSHKHLIITSEHPEALEIGSWRYVPETFKSPVLNELTQEEIAGTGSIHGISDRRKAPDRPAGPDTAKEDHDAGV